MKQNDQVSDKLLQFETMFLQRTRTCRAKTLGKNLLTNLSLTIDKFIFFFLIKQDEIERFLNLHQIKFSGFDLPKPIFSLDEINFPIYIMNELKLQGLQRPTAIQSMTWPVLYSGRDIMCIGLPISSRVLSVSLLISSQSLLIQYLENISRFYFQYICPALVFIKEQSIEVRKQGALVLIVTQTKEVAKEILTNAQMFMHQANCSFSCLFDDENVNTQVLHLRDNGKMSFKQVHLNERLS